MTFFSLLLNTNDNKLMQTIVNEFIIQKYFSIAPVFDNDDIAIKYELMTPAGPYGSESLTKVLSTHKYLYCSVGYLQAHV